MVIGGGQTRHSWKYTAQNLASEDFCCLTVDLKGHGESYWHPETEPEAHPYAPSPLAEDLDRLVDFLVGPRTTNDVQTERRQVMLIGASLGGLAIMKSRAKLNARGIVFVDVSPRVEPAGANRIISTN